jgi:hypothetical protein
MIPSILQCTGNIGMLIICIQSIDEALLDQMIEEERELHEQSQQMAVEEEQRSRQQKLKQRDELIDDLVCSNRNVFLLKL